MLHLGGLATQAKKTQPKKHTQAIGGHKVKAMLGKYTMFGFGCDHVVLLDDEFQVIAKEIVRSGKLIEKIHKKQSRTPAAEAGSSHD
jgi:hypothetical protein